MKRVFRFLTSMPFMAFILLMVAFSMAIATFIESSYGTPAARSLVYDRFWFELLWILLAINLLNNLFRYRLFTRRRFTMGLFHISFLVILTGAAITRYFSYEGLMHIRENQSSDFILSADTYFYAGIADQEEQEKVIFSELTPGQFQETFLTGNNSIKIKTVGFINDAQRRPVPSETGQPVVDFVFASPSQQGMQNVNLTAGDVVDIGGLTVGFGNNSGAGIHLFTKNEELMIVSDLELGEMTMSSQEVKNYNPGDTIPAKSMFLYQTEDFRFLIRNYIPHAQFVAAKAEMATGLNAVMVEISENDRKQVIPVFGSKSSLPDTVRISLAGEILKLAYGPRTIHVPFSIYLKDFQLERYPGSQSPSSFASEVVLVDENSGIKKDVRIFMNNTLLHKGFKFFQSSYDADEQGTVLSVNHDLWGTWVTYIGYILLAVGIILSLANPNSYFMYLAQKLKQPAQKAAAVLLLTLMIPFATSAQPAQEQLPPRVPENIANEFSRLWVQGIDGRIEPVSTLTSEIVRKVSRKSTLYGMDPTGVVLSMMAWPDTWQKLPVIRVSEDAVAAGLGIQGKYMTMEQLFDSQGNYRIAEQVRQAYAKTPAFRNRIEKEYINLDERVNVAFMVFRGDLLNLFPREKHEDSWYSPGEVAMEYTGGDSLFIKSGMNLMLQSLVEGNTEQASRIILAASAFQQKYGDTLLPSEQKKQIEILYNKIDPFRRIFPLYLLAGFLLLTVLIANVFRQKPLPKLLRFSFLVVIWLLFLVHTAGLIARWYISGHAPWSNGFESVVYVAWAAMLAGLIFGRRYPMVTGTAAFLTGISLFVAHLSWMNPEITPLVPVLKSYWLTIHVSIITASYGFLGLSAFLGILVLIMIVLRNSANRHRVSAIIDQLTTVNEMSATVGLYFLTIGTFIGGVWANESWGRYWGWDPKETWALITVVLYSFIVHMRLIPSLRGIMNYTVASVLGFTSVLMTYFGVNYFLSGLHSYGKGVADGIHPAVYVFFALLFGLMLWAWYREEKYQEQNG